MENKDRILTIDVMRGLTLFLMLFVNDLYVPGVPAWLTHRAVGFDGMGLADWVFPGFLFMVGLAVPFAIQNRKKKGESILRISGHIILQTVRLLTIGVLMFNIHRINPELTGMNKYLWAILVFLCIFLIWNQYRNAKLQYKFILKGVGVLGLIALVAIYRSGTPDDILWLKTGWWGILGLIGWGYFVTAFTYLLIKDNLIIAVFVWLFFILLNVLSQLEIMAFADSAHPVFGVILDGNIPSIVLSGLIFSLLLRKFTEINFLKFITYGAALGGVALGAGFVLRHWFIVSKIAGTPSWAMICTGISMLLFVVLYVVVDILGKHKWALIFKWVGKNSLTTYLAPDVLYFAIWLAGSTLFYKHSEDAFFIILGSLAWSLLMVGFTALLSWLGIRLKL
jgi:predicted acyltransferase